MWTNTFDVSTTLSAGGLISGTMALADGSSKDYKVVASLGTMLSEATIAVTDEIAWVFTVDDPCVQAGIIASKVADGETNLFEASVWIGDDAYEHKFYAYDDEVFITQGQDYCGDVSMSLVMSDQVTEITSTAITLGDADPTKTFADFIISAQSSDPADYTNSATTYYLKVSLVDYEQSSNTK